MATLAHEVSPNGREEEAHIIEGAIWNYAYSYNHRQNFQLEEGDIFRVIMSRHPDYIQDKNAHPDWTPEDWLKYGLELVEQTLATPLTTSVARNSCQRLQAIIDIANNPVRNPDVSLHLQHWRGRGDNTVPVP
jgi:hypothetical protein